MSQVNDSQSKVDRRLRFHERLHGQRFFARSLGKSNQRLVTGLCCTVGAMASLITASGSRLDASSATRFGEIASSESAEKRSASASMNSQWAGIGSSSQGFQKQRANRKTASEMSQVRSDHLLIRYTA